MGARVSSYILIAMMPFVAYSLVLQNALIAMRKQSQLILVQVIAVGLSAALAFVGAYIFRSLSALAAGVFIANIASGCATLWLAFYSTTPRPSEALGELLRELRPVAGLALIASVLIVIQGRWAILATWPAVLSEALVLTVSCVAWGMRNFHASMKTQ